MIKTAFCANRKQRQVHAELGEARRSMLSSQSKKLRPVGSGARMTHTGNGVWSLKALLESDLWPSVPQSQGTTRTGLRKAFGSHPCCPHNPHGRQLDPELPPFHYLSPLSTIQTLGPCTCPSLWLDGNEPGGAHRCFLRAPPTEPWIYCLHQ